MTGPLATIRASRRGRTHRHRVSLGRYRRFYYWTIETCPWRCSGAWMRHGLDITILPEIAPAPPLRRRHGA